MNTLVGISVHMWVDVYIYGQLNTHLGRWKNMCVDGQTCILVDMCVQMDTMDTHVYRWIHMWVDRYTCEYQDTHMGKWVLM